MRMAHLTHCCIVVKRHHNKVNSYDRKQLIGGFISHKGKQLISDVCPLSSWLEECQHTGRHGIGEVTGCSTDLWIENETGPGMGF